MLPIVIPEVEVFDESKQEFVTMKEQTLCLEHSLVSLSKWESKWCKPFLTKQEKTYEETIDYIKYMTLTPNVDPEVYNFLTDANIDEIMAYIHAPMTATTFSNERTSNACREIVTSELIYYWMVTLNIPFECQKWHLNRLLTLIKVCNIKSTPPKKMNRREILRRNSAINAARKKQLNTNG